MEPGPSGIRPDRARLAEVTEDGTATLQVGPGRTPVQVDAGSLPGGAEVGTWLIVDVQSMPPLPIGIDEALTADPPA